MLSTDSRSSLLNTNIIVPWQSKLFETVPVTSTVFETVLIQLELLLLVSFSIQCTLIKIHQNYPPMEHLQKSKKAYKIHVTRQFERVEELIASETVDKLLVSTQ